jgi:hypothetical protein
MADFYPSRRCFPSPTSARLRPLRKQPYGNWEFEVRDLNGYLLVFSEEA